MVTRYAQIRQGYSVARNAAKALYKKNVTQLLLQLVQSCPVSFKRFLKRQHFYLSSECKISYILADASRAFQASAAATKNARSSSEVRCVGSIKDGQDRSLYCISDRPSLNTCVLLV